MADRFVAADANPLIGLATAGAFHLLKDLFGRVTVTPAVRDEVLAGGSLPGAQARASGIAVTGLVGVLLAAKRAGFLPPASGFSGASGSKQLQAVHGSHPGCA